MEVIMILLSNEFNYFFSEEFTKELFNKIKTKLNDKFIEEFNFNSNKFGPNFNKKLRTLTKRIFLIIKKKIEFFNDNYLIEEKLKFFFDIFLKKTASCYLRLDDIQQLREVYANI